MNIEDWRTAWPRALEVWGGYVNLRDPFFCITSKEAAKENLTGSFAMIRLTDQQVVIDLQGVAEYKLEDYSVEILAHEIGHHVYAPANLTDHARIIAVIRKGLPTIEKYAPLVANLYTDLLINDRLQRWENLRMDKIYEALRGPSSTELWILYMRIYEILWSLTKETLTAAPSPEIERDARLGARLIRAYAGNHLKGAGGFSALVLPYLATANESAMAALGPWFDLDDAGEGGIPAGFAEVDAGESEPLHPADDPNVTGRAAGLKPVKRDLPPRDIVEYGEILKSMNRSMSSKDITAAYYRDLSSRHLIPFPEKQAQAAKDIQLEGLETWNIGESLERVDWFQSAAMSAGKIIPGFTVVERLHSEVPGQEPQKVPLDLYIGLDCSGSMSNPSLSLSYPVLAGTIIARSALRAGGRVMACLSGEQGSTIATPGFLRDEKVILEMVTGYLGSGYAFGIHYLKQHILERKSSARPIHLFIVSDQDMFTILAERRDGELGWDIARRAAADCGGGATMVLQVPKDSYPADIKRLQEYGWTIYLVDSMKEVVNLARKFSRRVIAQLEARK